MNTRDWVWPVGTPRPTGEFDGIESGPFKMVITDKSGQVISTKYLLPKGPYTAADIEYSLLVKFMEAARDVTWFGCGYKAASHETTTA